MDITNAATSLTGSLLTALAVLLRIVSNPLGNVFQKQLTTRGSHPLFVSFLTYAGLSGLCLVGGFSIDWKALPAAFWMYSVLGGIAGALGNGWLVRALQLGELSVLGPVNAYKSVVGMLFGLVLLGEVPNLWGVAGILLIIFGSYFVLDTTAERFSWKLLQKPEIQYRLGAMILTAIEAVFVKKIILASSIPLAFLSWCFFGAVFSFGLLFVYGLNGKKELQRLKATDLSTCVWLVLSLGIMQLTTNYTFEHLAVGYALALFQLSTLVSVLLGHRIFGEQNVLKKLVGAVIMLAGSVLIILLRDTA